MKSRTFARTLAGVALALSTSQAWSQTEITFDVNFHTVYEASGNFTPDITVISPGPFNNFEPIPEPNLIGTVTLTLIDGTTQLAPPPAVNTITLNGSFSTESGAAPSNSWTENVFDNAVFELYAPSSFVALDSTSDPRDWPLLTGTASDGLISDHGPAALYGGICPFDGGCLSANPFELFPEGTPVWDGSANAGLGAPFFPTYADAGTHALVSGSATQTINPNSLAYDNGMDAFVIEAVLDNLNGLQPYGDGVDGNPGIVRILTFSTTGATTYMVEGSIVEVPVPVPAAAWLFASSLGLLAWCRRRKADAGRAAACTAIVVAATSALAACGGSTSPPSTSTDNARPVADAGPDQLATELVPVQLDGSGSTDADGDALTFTWEFRSMPDGSTATLSDPNIVDPTFVPDLPGDYELRLTADDGFPDGPGRDTMTVTAEPAGTQPPVADAGPDQTVVYSPPSVTVNLDGTGSSDPDNDPLTYSWVITDFESQTGLPPANPVMLFGADTATPFFDVDEVDQLGIYTIELTVSDGVLADTDQVVVTVQKGMPVANVLFGSGLLGAAGVALRRRRLLAKVTK
jgi:hypothetical protein